jgi:hypothetical protein
MYVAASAKDSPTKRQLKQEMGERQLDSKLLNVRNCSMMTQLTSNTGVRGIIYRSWFPQTAVQMWLSVEPKTDRVATPLSDRKMLGGACRRERMRQLRQGFHSLERRQTSACTATLSGSQALYA